MKPWAEAFYKSRAWQDCRDGYARRRGYLCESCLAKGIYRPGEIVHHKVPLTKENIHDPEIALSWDNLELLCRDCHAERHNKTKRRYHIGNDGEVVF